MQQSGQIECKGCGKLIKWVFSPRDHASNPPYNVVTVPNGAYWIHESKFVCKECNTENQVNLNQE